MTSMKCHTVKYRVCARSIYNTRRADTQRGRGGRAAGRGAILDTQWLQARVVHPPPIPFPLPVRGDITPFG